MPLIFKTFSLFFLITLALSSCSDEETHAEPVIDAGSDATTDRDTTTDRDATPIPDGGMDIGDDADGGAPNTINNWDRDGACVINYIDGPMIVFMEKTDPAGCVQVVIEKSEEPSNFAELMVDIATEGWKTSAVLVEDGSCTPATLTEFTNGFSATKARGSVKFSVDLLGVPEALKSASLELTFSEDPENPFGPFVGVLEVSESIPLQKCKP